MNPARLTLLKSMPENEWQGWVVTLARLFGWMVYHPYDSRKSEAGWPDLALVRGHELIFAELKRQDGKVTGAQQKWLDALGAVPGVETYLWRPSDMDAVEARLRAAEAPIEVAS